MKLVEYPFKPGDRLRGPGCTGVAVSFPGPYSTMIKDDRDGKPLIVSNTQLRKEGEPDDDAVPEV